MLYMYIMSLINKTINYLKTFIMVPWMPRWPYTGIYTCKVPQQEAGCNAHKFIDESSRSDCGTT